MKSRNSARALCKVIPGETLVVVNRIGKAGTCGLPRACLGQSGNRRMDPECSRRSGKAFRSIRKNGTLWEDGDNAKRNWYVVKNCASRAGIKALAPHDLRRTCARLCHAAGGELEQIQFLLGHASVQTTERYIGCKQDLCRAVNDRLPFPSRTCSVAEVP